MLLPLLKLDLPHLPSHHEVLWSGIVKVDPSISQHVSEITEEEGDVKIIDVSDSNYPYRDTGQLDNLSGLDDFPNTVTIFVKGKEILEYMNCSVIMGYQDPAVKKGLFRNHVEAKKVSVKGFILEPVAVGSAYGQEEACLASIQADNRLGSSVTLEQSGIFAFTSGSQTSNITFGNPSRSVTIVFLASSDKPFVAYFHSKKGMIRLICNGNRMGTEEVARDANSTESSPSPPVDPLSILKVRLARGEITIEEYTKLRKILQDEPADSGLF